MIFTKLNQIQMIVTGNYLFELPKLSLKFDIIAIATQLIYIIFALNFSSETHVFRSIQIFKFADK